MVVLEKRDREQAEKDRETNMDKLVDILYNVPDITYRTTWGECQKLLAESEVFMSDPIIKKISKLDALRVFKDHIVKLEKEHEEEVKVEKRQRKRAHRKNREMYLVMLDELRKQGDINSLSKWKTVFPQMRNDVRFLNLLVSVFQGYLKLTLMHLRTHSLAFRMVWVYLGVRQTLFFLYVDLAVLFVGAKWVQRLGPVQTLRKGSTGPVPRRSRHDRQYPERTTACCQTSYRVRRLHPSNTEGRPRRRD